MKLIIREYLRALKERGELDAVLPDLLAELGFTVYSRPSVGVRQYGVDVAAVGQGADGVQRVHLFSVKSGDLTRQDWDSASVQSLRPSLNEIRDHYIATRIPSEYAELPVVICLCFGGDIDEGVRAELTGYIQQNTTPQVSYEEWNGDRLADAILGGIFREALFPEALRRHLRKSLAMVEEPDIAFLHFARLVNQIVKEPGTKTADRLTRIRLINIALWMLFGWAREAGNVEAAYRASELAVLYAWELLRGRLGKPSKISQQAGLLFHDLVELQFAIWAEIFDRKLLPHASTRHGLVSMVGSHASIDINLKVFDTIGRLALRGLWLVWDASKAAPLPRTLTHEDKCTAAIDKLAGQLIEIIANNQVLLTPIKDDQVIDISLALTFLAVRKKRHQAVSDWLNGLAFHCAFAYRSHGGYPTSKTSYWDLVEHPSARTDEYRREATEGSVLYPTIALWASVFNAETAIQTVAKLKDEELDHCNFQFWVPNDESEEQIYLGRELHGSSFNDIPVVAGTQETLEIVRHECAASQDFDQLSAINFDHWPVLLTACRHYRLPIPPHLWMDLFTDIIGDDF